MFRQNRGNMNLRDPWYHARHHNYGSIIHTFCKQSTLLYNRLVLGYAEHWPTAKCFGLGQPAGGHRRLIYADMHKASFLKGMAHFSCFEKLPQLKLPCPSNRAIVWKLGPSYLTLTLTDDLDLGTKGGVLPQKTTNRKMKALSLTIQRLWPMSKIFEDKQTDRQTNRQVKMSMPPIY